MCVPTVGLYMFSVRVSLLTVGANCYTFE